MCETLGVSRSGYYAWRDRPPSAKTVRDAELLVEIRKSHAISNGAYGVPNIFCDLRDWGFATSRKRIARLMRAEGLRGVCRRRKTTITTVRAEESMPSPDLVDRNFTANGPNKLWVADITYIQTWESFLYLAVVLDAWSRKVIGWSISAKPDTQLVLRALDTAIAQRRPKDVVHHSDHGCQYTSIEFTNRLADWGLTGSYGSIGDCFDNAAMEAFWATLKKEIRHIWGPIDAFTRSEMRTILFDYIEVFYNRSRHQVSLEDRTPAETYAAGRAA